MDGWISSQTTHRRQTWLRNTSRFSFASAISNRSPAFDLKDHLEEACLNKEFHRLIANPALANASTRSLIQLRFVFSHWYIKARDHGVGLSFSSDPDLQART